jgi:ABC-2 type transport system permease protein
MRSVLALLRAALLSASSYRVATLLSLLALLVSVVPIYFVAGALQPVVEESIRPEGGVYFGFLIVGLAAIYLISAALGAIPGALAGSIGNGTFESLLVTRATLPSLLAGMAAYPLLHSVARALILLVGAAIIGVPVTWSALPAAIVIAALLVLTYAAIGLVGASLILVFRTAGPLQTAVITLSGLLGGVYYSTTVIPDWLQALSAVVPLTYGLRAIRMLLLNGSPLGAVMGDVTILVGITAAAVAIGGTAFLLALRRARVAGTLSQY